MCNLASMSNQISFTGPGLQKLIIHDDIKLQYQHENTIHLIHQTTLLTLAMTWLSITPGKMLLTALARVLIMLSTTSLVPLSTLGRKLRLLSWIRNTI